MEITDNLIILASLVTTEKNERVRLGLGGRAARKDEGRGREGKGSE